MRVTFLLLLFLLATPALAQDADTAYLQRPIDLVRADADLATIAADLADKAGIRIEVPKTTPKLSVELKRVPWLTAFEHVLAKTGLRARSIPGGVALEPRPPVARVSLKAGERTLRAAIAAIVSVSGFSLVVAPGVDGTIGLPELRDEPWPRALRAVLEPRGLHAHRRGDVIVVSPWPGA